MGTLCCVLSLLLIFSGEFISSEDILEVIEKLSSQTYSFLMFATESEEDLHPHMHLLVRYYLYPKKSKAVEISPYDTEGLKNSTFDFDKPSIIVVHGYTDSRKRNIIVRLRKGELSCELFWSKYTDDKINIDIYIAALVSTLDVNVIVCDWQQAAGQIYFTAVGNTVSVGKELGDFLSHLEYCGYNLSKIHLVGHSLGAQISGIAGNRVDGRIGRITGLDPAGPLFEFLDVRNDSLSLDETDARFVDVIHSSVGSFGVFKAIGHADFYPNDGLVPQPGCSNFILAVSCSHVRSIEFFIESLNETLPKYLSKRCSTWKNYHLMNCTREQMVPMGYYTPIDARGSFYLQTNMDNPFGLDGKFYKRSVMFVFEPGRIETK